MEAYILINAEAGMIWEVAGAALKIDAVKWLTPGLDSLTLLFTWSLRGLRSLEK